MSNVKVESSHVDTIRHWQENPGDFVRDMFGVEPDVWQSEALAALNDHDRVSVRSGHGIGKSAFMAWAILWWMFTRYPCKVACTAPTSHQLNDVLWGEIAKWVEKIEYIATDSPISGDHFSLLPSDGDAVP